MNHLKHYFLSISILFLSLEVYCNGVVTSKIIDNDSKTPLAYVNVGIAQKGIGTVSNEAGYFQLQIPDSLFNENISFSILGYEVQSFECAQVPKVVSMIKKDHKIDEVLIQPGDFITRIVGNKTNTKAIQAGFINNNLGHELGVHIKIKERPSKIKSLTINVSRCTFDSVFYRLNIYRVVEGAIGLNLFKNPVYLSYSKKDLKNAIYLNVEHYNLYVDNDFVVALELVKDLGDGDLYFSSGLFNNKSVYRKTSLDNWEKAPIGIGISAIIEQEK